MQRSEKPKRAWLKTSAMLMLLAALMMGCAAPSTVSAPAYPVLPPRPSLQELIPQQSYSDSAQRNISEWQRRLTDTLLTR